MSTGGTGRATGLRHAVRGTAARAYGAALRARYARGGMPWDVNGETVRIDPRVRHLVPHASERPLFDFLKSHIEPGARVLDVSAFLGVYAVMASRWSGPRGRVLALEPTAWSAEVARRHIHYNAGQGAPITLVEAAAADTSGTSTLHEYSEPYVNALAPAADVEDSPTLRAIDVVTVDSLCRQYQFDPVFIRMDVQGAEWHVLRGARETIRAAGRRLVIVAEMHPQCWPAFGVDAAFARETIASLRLEAAPLEPGTDLFARDGHVVFTPEASR